MKTLPDYLSVRATTLEDAWSRFDPHTPLPVGSPFYVEREDNPLEQIVMELHLAHSGAAKYFFAGHRGSGKSTELNRLVADPRIQKRYWPVKFSVREECDFNDLDVVEVLLAIGAQIYHQYTTTGGKMKKDLLVELDGWKGRTVERLNSKGATFQSGAGLDIGQFFLSALLKVKTEHVTRKIVRDEIRPRLSELIGIINLMSAEVLAQSKRQVLVVVEDMDKPPLKVSQRLFADGYSILTQPACTIIYTVPVAIYFDPTFIQIRETSHFLPNVKLHRKQQRDVLSTTGVRALRHFVLARMTDDLVAREALDEAVRVCGGVFRELTHVMQRAIINALTHGAQQVKKENVDWASAQIRSGFRRLLSDDDYRLLLDVRDSNEMRHPDKLGPLFHLLAVLEYTNGENWCDVHPALDSLLDEIGPTLNSGGEKPGF